MDSSIWVLLYGAYRYPPARFPTRKNTARTRCELRRIPADEGSRADTLRWDFSSARKVISDLDLHPHAGTQLGCSIGRSTWTPTLRTRKIPLLFASGITLTLHSYRSETRIYCSAGYCIYTARSKNEFGLLRRRRNNRIKDRKVSRMDQYFGQRTRETKPHLVCDGQRLSDKER